MLLTYVVVLADPFHCTVDELIKFVPLTAKLKDDPPIVALDGLRLAIAGTGFPGTPPMTCPTVFTTTAPEFAWP